MYRAIHVRDGAQLVELTHVAFKLKLTFAPLVVMITATFISISLNLKFTYIDGL